MVICCITVAVQKYYNQKKIFLSNTVVFGIVCSLSLKKMFVWILWDPGGKSLPHPGFGLVAIRHQRTLFVKDIPKWKQSLRFQICKLRLPHSWGPLCNPSFSRAFFSPSHLLITKATFPTYSFLELEWEACLVLIFLFLYIIYIIEWLFDNSLIGCLTTLRRC